MAEQTKASARASCEELREALDTARAQLEPPSRDATLVSGVAGPVNLDPGDTTPDARPEVWARIHEIEAALRAAGCE